MFSGRRGGDMLCRPVAFTVISTLDPAFCLAAALAGMSCTNSASRSNQRSCKQAQHVGAEHDTVDDMPFVNVEPGKAADYMVGNSIVFQNHLHNTHTARGQCMLFAVCHEAGRPRGPCHFTNACN